MVSEQVLGFVVKARDEASPTLDSVENKVLGFGSKSKLALGAAGAAAGALAGAGFGVLGQRTIELDESMAKLRAETGASVEQTNALKDSVVALSRGSLETQGSISGVMSDLISLQGIEASNTEELSKLTQQYLDFATATGTEAAANVAAFDDILDGFNLTAGDAQGIMDKLVLSHQKFGLDVAGSEAALAKLAPTFKALNLDVDDGIGLLNLFAASGVDSSAASAAMAKATDVLTDETTAGYNAQKELSHAFRMTGVEFDAFFKMTPEEKFALLTQKMTETEDPARRAEMAMGLFGARGGAALASALGNANDGLASFQVSADEAAGAASEAAAEIEGTFHNRLKLLKNDIMGRAQDITKDFAPALMAIGVVGPQAAGAIGALGGVLTTFGSGVAAVAKTVGLALLTPPLGIFVAIIAALALVALAFHNNWFDIRGKTQAFADFVVQKVTWVKDGIVGAFQGALDRVQAIWAALPGIIKAPINGAIGYVNRLILAWNNLQFSVGGGSYMGISIPELSFGTPDIGTIPMMAAGGIVTRPTLAFLGEAGPEAVIPLSRMGSGSRVINVHVHVTHPLGTPEQVGNAVLRGIEHLKSTGALPDD